LRSFGLSTFSHALIERCKKYFAQQYKRTLTSEEAEAFLWSLSDLYLHFTKEHIGGEGGVSNAPSLSEGARENKPPDD
jgi:hypothetical protein